MAEKFCPVEGFENFVIDYPDDLKRGHMRVYADAVTEFIAADGRDLDEIPMEDCRFAGTRALCTRFENPPDEDVDEWPLAVYRWFMDTVYWDHYEPAANPPKN